MIAIGSPPSAAAQTVADPRTSAVSIPRVTSPPRLEEFLEANPGAERASQFAHITEFTQRAPADGEPATEQTEVFLGRDDSRLYVVFIASDREPAKVRARLERREGITFDEDQVGFYLDTFDDRRRAYQFETNALGIQDDSLYSEDTGVVDDTFDTVWDSDGQLTARGFVVLMSIPFKSLRFSPDATTWRVAFWRWIARRSEGVWWPRETLTIRGLLSQAAALDAPTGITGNRNLQLVPYGSWRAIRAIDQRIPAEPMLTSSLSDAKVGGDAKFVVRNSVVIDATANPDFAQIESDEPQSIVNQRFEVFFPERRPFFTENGNYFALPLTIGNERFLFTRRIGDPQIGVRLTGKVGAYSLGAIGADDRGPGEIVPDADSAAGHRAYTGVVRISRELTPQSNVGALVTERRFLDSFSRLVAADSVLRLTKTWSASVVLAKTWNRSNDGTPSEGTDVEARLRRESRVWNYDLRWLDRSPAFHTDLGFVPRADERVLTQVASYTSYEVGRWFRDVKAELLFDKAWDWRGTDLFAHVNPTLTLDFRDPTTVSLYQQLSSDTLRPGDYAALPTAATYREHLSGVSVSSRHFRQVGITAMLEVGRWINYVPPVGRAPDLAEGIHGQLIVTVRPVGPLQIANTYLLDQSAAPYNAGTMFSSNVFRSKWSWQFSREWSLRVIGQYNSLVANPSLTSQPAARSINADVLATYLVHPGTAFYIGYASDSRRPFPLDRGTGAADRFGNDGRQLFVKVSYLVRP